MRELIETMTNSPTFGASALTGSAASWLGNLPIILESLFLVAGIIWLIAQTYYIIKNKGLKK